MGGTVFQGVFGGMSALFWILIVEAVKHPICQISQNYPAKSKFTVGKFKNELKH